MNPVKYITFYINTLIFDAMIAQHLINRSNHASGVVFNTSYFYVYVTTEKSTVVGLLNVMRLDSFNQIAQKTITADFVKLLQQNLNLSFSRGCIFLFIKRSFILKRTSFWRKINIFCHFLPPS